MCWKEYWKNWWKLRIERTCSTYMKIHVLVLKCYLWKWCNLSHFSPVSNFYTPPPPESFRKPKGIEMWHWTKISFLGKIELPGWFYICKLTYWQNLWKDMQKQWIILCGWKIITESALEREYWYMVIVSFYKRRFSFNMNFVLHVHYGVFSAFSHSLRDSLRILLLILNEF